MKQIYFTVSPVPTGYCQTLSSKFFSIR